MKLKPAGFHIIVKPDYEEVTKSGIVLAVSDRSGVAYVDTGVVVAIGPTAWKAYDSGEPWAKLGDRVGYGRYAGKIIYHKDNPNDKYVLLADGDVQVIYEESNND